MIYAFGDIAVDLDRMQVTADGEPVKTEPQVFAVLVYLITHRGRVVTKEELLDEVWGDRFVSESALTTRIKSARRVAGDDGGTQAVIRTVHGRGYEFIAPVRELTEPEPAGASTTVAHDSRLPAAVQSLVGREDLLEEILGALADCRLVTLVGPAGVGKTAVAYELARRLEDDYRDGVHACELVTVVDADAVAGALATMLEVNTRREMSLDDAVVDLLRPRQALVVLDNCEHLVEPVSGLVDRIMRAAPEVTIIATSREPLAVAGERTWPVDPLPVALDSDAPLELLLDTPAIALFADRAQAADHRFTLTDANIGPVMEICRRLDGIPLAIELAAARTRAMDVADIAARLDERFRLLKGVRRDADPRHRALDDAVRWSYDLLADTEQRLFSRLSIFAGPFAIDAAEKVCGVDDLDIVDGLTGLAERSMVAMRRPDGGGTTYEQLETLRAYGRSRLDDDDRVELTARHTAFYAELAADVGTGLLGADERMHAERGHSAFADLRAAQRSALQVGDLDSAFSLIAAVAEYAMRTMRYEVLGWAHQATQAPDAETHALYPTMLGMHAYSLWMRGDFDAAVVAAEEVADAETTHGTDRCGLAERVVANVHYAQGDSRRGLETTHRQLELADASGSPSRIVHAGYMHAVACSLSDRDLSRSLIDRIAPLAEASGSPTDLASVWVARGFVADDGETALDAFDRCDRLARQAGNRWMSTFARTEASGLLLEHGQLAEACAGLSDVVDVWLRAGEWSQLWLTLSRCVVALSAVGDTDLATEVIGAVGRRSDLGAAPVVPELRRRTLETDAELRAQVGDAAYEERRAAGAAMPVVDLVDRTVRALRAAGAA